ncbi:gastrula zinc finger protein XlCGF7.1-like [Bombina bombina]|uniref:gastrula zinc finger protein XlCGF7.1-like n=1 Tax=Bombina bombina TaxID=8345 RepID=UPI00235AE728|nr:gastrula zinc finger protein XlCGF7.1-like [Bombina bombina]
MSDKNQTSELPDADRGRLEENTGTGLLHVKEEDEKCDVNRHQTEKHWSLPADADIADIVKVEITEDLFTCDPVKTEEDEVPINTSTGEFTNCSNYSHGQKADTSFSFLRNQRSHMGNICSECGKCFTWNSKLIEHLKMYTGDEPFLCSVCWKVGRHDRIHTGEKAFLCSDCGKCFTLKSSLIRHQKLHTGEKEFVCSECGKCFTQKPHLIRHQKSHTGEKTFLCSDCGKCFTLKSTLDNHMKIHTGEKAFSCSKCGKCFTQQSTLINHQKVHVKGNQSLFSEKHADT